MLTPYYARLITSQVDGAAVTTNGADTSILPTTARYTLPAQFLQFIGQDLRIRAAGRISTTTSGTLTFKIMGGSGTTAIFTSAALALIASQTNQTFELDITLTVRAVGSGTSANAMVIGRFMASPALLAVTTTMLPATAPVVGGGFDTTIANLIDLTANWSATGNSLTCHQYCLDACL
jgi:hypothetical protein